MTKITPQQIDRGLTIVEAAIDLATDVWRNRKLARRVAPKLAAPRKGIHVANANRKARNAAKKSTRPLHAPAQD